MRRHIIRPFDRVNERRVAIPHQPAKKIFEVYPDVRVGIFLDQKRSRSVPDVQRHQPGLKLVLQNPAAYLVGEFIQPPAAGRDSYFFESLTQQAGTEGLKHARFHESTRPRGEALRFWKPAHGRTSNLFSKSGLRGCPAAM